MLRKISCLVVVSASFFVGPIGYAQSSSEFSLKSGLSEDTTAALHRLGLHSISELLTAELQTQQLEREQLSAQNIEEIRKALADHGVFLYDNTLERAIARGLSLDPQSSIAPTTRLSHRLQERLEKVNIRVYADLLDRKKRLDARYGLPPRFEREFRQLLAKANLVLNQPAELSACGLLLTREL